MPKMGCWCGYVFQFDVNPEDYELCLVPLKFIHEMIDRLDKGPVTGEEFSDRSIENSRDAHPCPQCGRLYIETEQGSGVYDLYVKEDQRRGLWPLRIFWRRSVRHLARARALLHRR